MKKLFVMMALGLGLVSVANAQYAPQKGDFATEIGFTPFNTDNGESFKLNEGMFKVRYFLTDKDALRLKLGVGIDNSSTTTTDGNTPTDLTDARVWNSTTEINNKKTTFSFKVGYERHFAVSGRFDVYAGAEFGYKMSKCSGDASYDYFATFYDHDKKVSGTRVASYSVEATNQQIASTSFDPANGDVAVTGTNSSLNTFVGGVFAGLDFYVYKNLYLGAELGISFESGKSPNRYYDYNSSVVANNAEETDLKARYVSFSGESGTKVITDVNGSTTTTETVNTGARSNETTTTKLKFYVEPAIRLGWRF